MKVLIDANVLLDVALKREGFEASSKLLDLCQDGRLTGVIAWHTLSVFHYVCAKKKGDKKAREGVTRLLDILEVAQTDTKTAKQAAASPIKDFEDALQAMAALKAGCEYIVTRNAKDFKNSVIATISPEGAVQ